MNQLCPRCKRRFEETFPLCPFDGTRLIPATEGNARTPPEPARRDTPTIALGKNEDAKAPDSFYDPSTPIPGKGPALGPGLGGDRMEPLSLGVAGAELRSGAKAPASRPLDPGALELVDRGPAPPERNSDVAELPLHLDLPADTAGPRAVSGELDIIGARQDRVGHVPEMAFGIVATVVALIAVGVLHRYHSETIDTWEPVQRWSEKVRGIRTHLAPQGPAKGDLIPDFPSDPLELPPEPARKKRPRPRSKRNIKGANQGSSSGPSPILSRDELERRARARRRLEAYEEKSKARTAPR